MGDICYNGVWICVIYSGQKWTEPNLRSWSTKWTPQVTLESIVHVWRQLCGGLRVQRQAAKKKRWGFTSDLGSIFDKIIWCNRKKCVLRETTPNKLFFSFQIIIPFFSLFVKDLYFLNEGCSNKLPNGDINFEKFWQLAKQISDFITWQQAEVGSYIFYQWIMSRSIWQCIYT